MPHLDFSQPPFDVLNLAERQSLEKHTQVRYLGAKEFLPPTDFQYFFIVLKGQIEQTLNGDFTATYLGAEHTDHVQSNDWFDSRRRPNADELTEDSTSILIAPQPANTTQFNSNSPQPNSYQYQAYEDTLLLQVDGSAIDRISAQNHLIRQLLSDDLPERLKALQQRRSAQNQALGFATTSYTAQQEVQQIMLQPVTDVPLLPIHIIDADQSLYQAAQMISAANLKHILVRPTDHLKDNSDSERCSDRTLGILTDTDICRAVSERSDPATTPCQSYASFNLRTIDDDHEIGDALLTMTRYRIHRLPVIDHNGKAIGVLGQSDMLAHIGHHSQLISIQIEQAKDIASVGTAVELIGRYIRAQQQNGVKIGIVSRMVQTLNAQVFTKLWELIVPAEVMQNTCVIVMGSEGRGEQIMRTDQDNALIIRDGYAHPDLAKFAQSFNQQLADFGYPLCDGNIMMTNPMWRQPLKSFKTQISLWFRNTDPMHGIYLSAILDGEYVCGDEMLLTQIREHLKTAHHHSDLMFVRQFVQAALQFGEINQWWQKFVPLLGKPSAHNIDLKKAGIFPIVHGIRTMAPEYDIFAAPSTKSRLKALVNLQVLTQERADTLNEALEYFMAQRLSVALISEDKYAHQVDPTTLSALERDILKECLAVVKSFKAQLRQHYQLDFG